MNGFEPNHTGEAHVANESDAWLEFVGAATEPIERMEQRRAPSPRVTSKLIAAATRLQTRTARVLALSMINQRDATGSHAGPTAACRLPPQ